MISAPTNARSVSSNTDSEYRQRIFHHSKARLGGVYKGQSKDAVFASFATVFREHDGRVVEIQGMRLVTFGQSAKNTRVEIAEVNLAEEDGRPVSYWFLFEKDRLLAWGNPEEWTDVARKYGRDIPYRPQHPRWRVEASLEQRSGR